MTQRIDRIILGSKGQGHEALSLCSSILRSAIDDSTRLYVLHQQERNIPTAEDPKHFTGRLVVYFADEAIDEIKNKLLKSINIYAGRNNVAVEVIERGFGNDGPDAGTVSQGKPPRPPSPTLSDTAIEPGVPQVRVLP